MDKLTITHVSVFPVKEPQGKLRAFVRMVLNEQFQLTQMRLYQGDNGMFVGYPIDPSVKGDDYRQMFYPLTRELREEVDKLVIAEYLKMMEKL